MDCFIIGLEETMAEFDRRSDASGDSMNLEEMFSTAEENLRRGLDTLSVWGDQARDIIENRPGVVLASLSIAGFMTGLLVRGGRPMFEKAGAKGFMADPLIVFLTRSEERRVG